MLVIADIFLTIIHLVVVAFNLFGWIPKRTRKANFILIVLTAASWFLVGIWHGMGYCFLTDWQWDIKERLGETNIPNNFVEYIAEKVFNREFVTGFIGTLTAVCFGLAVMASVYVNFVLPQQKRRAGEKHHQY